jgi:glycosyltransferase involved in cell wall biosynthesis
MRIMMVLSVKTYPPDGRVEREARDLVRDGHDVFLMARRGKGQPRTQNVAGVNVLRPLIPWRHVKFIGPLIYGLQRYWIFFSILMACRRHKIEALHVHDLPYSFATVAAGKVLGIPVVFDMHEHYTVMLQTGFDFYGNAVLRPFFALMLAILRWEEKVSCRWARKVIVVADEHVSRIEQLGVARENIVEVTNTEDVDHFGGLEIDTAIQNEYANDFVILYFGGFAGHRGIETAIAAMPRILEDIPNARLLLVGDGYNRRAMEALAADLPCSDRVVFTGHQPFKLLPTYITLCEICLIPHISTPHIETTMPNKIFQSMILGKVVVVSSTRPMMRIVEDAECGRVFTERDPESLSATILDLQDEAQRRRLGENGRLAVLDRYNWANTVQALLDIYRGGVLARRSKTA